QIKPPYDGLRRARLRSHRAPSPAPSASQFTDFTCNTRTSVVDFPRTPSLTYHHVAVHRPLGEVTVELSRRDALRALATGATAAAGMAFIGVPAARADGLGTLIDYSTGVPSPEAIRAAGYKGAIRYCSEP